MGLFKRIFKGNTLFYPGCLTKFVLKDIQAKYESLFRKEGIDFIMLKDKEYCCGSPLKNSGNQVEFKEIAEKNLKAFKDHGIDRIITNCPACALVLRKDYKEMLGDRWDIDVKHATEVLQRVSASVSKGTAETVTYHDPCHLGRGLGVYGQPRKIIEKAGYKIEEMQLTKDKSYCCGGGGGVKSNNKELANRIATDRICQAKNTSAKVLVTPCPMCYANLKENAGDIEVKELSQIIQ